MGLEPEVRGSRPHPSTFRRFEVLDSLEARMAAYYQGDPAGFEEVTVGASVVGLNPPDLCNSATVQAQEEAVRFRLDGGTPTGDVGHILNAMESVQLSGIRSIYGFQAIRDGTADAAVAVHYFT